MPFKGALKPAYALSVSGLGRRCLGRNAIPAITVGTTALAITVATRKEYCFWETMPCEKPYNAEIVPKVRPVDIISV